MQYKNILGGLVIFSFLYGCGNSSSDEKTEIKKDTTVAPVDTNTNKTADTNSTVQNTILPATGTDIKFPASTLTTGKTGALNPEHGKPGHRCDIAVGAPLDSKPAADYTPASTTTTKPVLPSPVTISPTTISTTPAPAAPAATTTVAPGMNPAHGQPGHRCDIAVGAPLNSKPSTTTPTVTQPVSLTPQTTPAATPVVTPVSAPVATGPGLNPAHGQPGHRCDIAVGAPLNSEPKKN